MYFLTFLFSCTIKTSDYFSSLKTQFEIFKDGDDVCVLCITMERKSERNPKRVNIIKLASSAKKVVSEQEGSGSS